MMPKRKQLHVTTHPKRKEDVIVTICTLLELFLSKRDSIWMKYVCQRFSRLFNKWKCTVLWEIGTFVSMNTEQKNEVYSLLYPEKWCPNKNLDELPDHIQRINIETDFVVTKWPSALTELKIRSYTPIPLPTSLTRLDLVACKWRSEYIFPPQLIHLSCFSILSDVVLPSLISLRLYCLESDVLFPLSLQHLCVVCEVKSFVVKQFRNLTNLISLDVLTTHLALTDCPSQLKELTADSFSSDNQDAIQHKLETVYVSSTHLWGKEFWLPTTLHTLCTEHPEFYLTNVKHGCITRLQIDKIYFNTVYETIKHLTLNSSFNRNLQSIFPNLVTMSIRRVNDGIPLLPETLQELSLERFDQPITQLPSNLKVLDLGNAFNQPIGIGELPRSLIRLELGTNFKQPLRYLPAGLKQLVLPVGYACRIPPHVDVRYREPWT